MENKINAYALAEAWQQILSEADQKRKLNADLFKETFTQTFQLLKGCAKETRVEKELIPLIISAHAFSIADREQAEAQCSAAGVLTERMLHRCLMDREAVGIPEGAHLYLLEERKEIYLDFDEVHVALETLTALMHRRELL